MNGKKSNDHHDLKSLVKLVLTRPERHELRDLTEAKRAGSLDADAKARLRELKDKVAFAALANNAQTVYSYTVEENGRGRARSNPNMRAYDKGRESPGYRPGPSDDANGFYNNDSNEDSDDQAPRKSKTRPAPKTPRTSFSAADHSRYYSMLNKAVKKDFGHHGVFMGSVTNMVDVPGHPTPFFKIKYEDGDVEDVDYEELQKIMVKEKEPIRKKKVDKKITAKSEEVVEEQPAAIEEANKPSPPRVPINKPEELINFHKEVPAVTEEPEERSRAVTSDAVVNESSDVKSKDPPRRETVDAVIGRDKASNQPKWKLASASTLSNKLNSHNQSRGNPVPRPNAGSSPRANSGIAARWLQVARSDSEAEKMVLSDTDRGVSSADERRTRVSIPPKKVLSDLLPLTTLQSDESKSSPKRVSNRERGSDSDASPRRSSLKEPNSPKLGPKRRLSWRLNKESDADITEPMKESKPPPVAHLVVRNVAVPQTSSQTSPQEPRSPKLSRWDADALKQQVKDAEARVVEMRVKQRGVLLKAMIGRLRYHIYNKVFRRWSVHVVASLMSTVRRLQSEQSSGDASEDLLVAREHIQQYESQMAQLREKLAEAESSLRYQAEERARRVATLVEERARAVVAEDFEKALALHHQISALNMSAQLADDNVKVASPVRNAAKESLLGSFAGLATLTLSPVTANTTLRMVHTPKRDNSTKIQVERLGDHGTVIAPADSKLINSNKEPNKLISNSNKEPNKLVSISHKEMPAPSQSMPKFLKKSSYSASWIAKDPVVEEEDSKHVVPSTKPKVTRSNSILERAAQFSKKADPTDKKALPRRSSSSKRPIEASAEKQVDNKPSLIIRTNSKSDSESTTTGLPRKSSSEEVMMKLKSVVSQRENGGGEPARKMKEILDSDNEELWIKKLSPEKAALFKKKPSSDKSPPSPRKPDSPRAPKWSEKTNSNSFKTAEAKEAKAVKSALNAKVASPSHASGAKRVPSIQEKAQLKRGSSSVEREGVKKVPSTQSINGYESPAEPKTVTSPPATMGRKTSIGRLFNQMNDDAVICSGGDSADIKPTAATPIQLQNSDTPENDSEMGEPPLARGKRFGSPKKDWSVPAPPPDLVETSVEYSGAKLKTVVPGQSSNKFPATLERKPTVGRDLPEVTPITGSAKAVYAEMTKTMKAQKSKSMRNSMRHHEEWGGAKPGDSCWLSDPHNAYLRATIEEVVSPSELKVLTGGDRPLTFMVDLEQKEIKVGKRMKAEAPRRVLPREKNESANYDDMDELPYLHEASILHNVDVRFRVDKIYTNTGPILVAMNPFKWLPIYDEDVMRQYLNRPHGALPPHCFAEAEASFQALNSSKINQAIIMCGDSGAGKTETTKLMLAYLSFVSETRSHGEAVDGITMAERLVECAPLLEALGNAKTLKNSNSSRFSKLSALHFSESPLGIGQIEGATLSNLLLESSRVSFQPTGERNYHVFYQLLESSLKFRKQNGLEALNEITAETACYTNHSGCISVPTIDDAEDFDSTIASMVSLQINPESRSEILRTLSGILMLGNVKFEDGKGDESSVVADRKFLDLAADLLGLPDADKLAAALVVQIRVLPGGNSIKCGQTAVRSGDLRDALAKAVYFKLFNWVSEAINKSLRSGKKVKRVIGVLDIFGFEDMSVNSFEQLLINTTNELLQTLFNNTVFKAESEEYIREGIMWDETTFPDNTDTMALLERKPLGLLPYLDSECSRGNAALDGEALTRAFNKNNASHPKYTVCGPSTNERRNDRSRTHDEDFLIKHFAGDVVYTVSDFIPKNRDELFAHVQDLLKSSTHSIKLFKADEDQSKSRTVTSKFMTQLSDLRAMLSESDTRFVRCIKSNENNSPQEVNRVSVLRQLVCGGVIAALEVRKAGFPNKMLYRDFVREFRVFTPSGKVFKDDEELALNMFLHPRVRERVSVSAIRPGNSKLFMQADVLYQLRFLKDYEIYPFVCRIQRWWEEAQGDRTQRLVLRCHKAIHNAMDKASMNGVQFNEDVDHAIEHALELLELAEEVAGVAKVVAKRKLNENNIHTIDNVKAAVVELEHLVDDAVKEKEDATKARAEVLANLDSHCNRLSFIFSVAETLLDEHARMTLFKTAKNAELQLHAVRQEYLLAGSEQKHTVSHNFRTSTNNKQSSRRIKKESAMQMRKLVSRLKSALERKELHDKKMSGKKKKKRGAVGSATQAFGFDRAIDGSVKMDEAQLRKVFDVVDLDKSGEIDAEELSAIMQEMSVDVAIADQAAQLVRKVNADELIGYDQFVAVMTEDSETGEEFRETFARLKDRIEKISDWQKQFESVDKDCSGGIDPEELSTAMGEMGDDPISEAEARCLIEFANRNNSGTLSMQDFVKMMTQVERFAGGEAARAAHLAKAFELVRHAEDLEHRYSEDNLKLVRARDAYRDSIIANEERLLEHDITKFQEAGITCVSKVFVVARGALDIADEALRGVDSDHLLQACEEATLAVDAALEVMQREDRRIALLAKCKATELKVIGIRTKATSGATEGLLETSTDLSASLREAENTLAKFNEMRFGRASGPTGARDEVVEDAALTMDLDELEEKVGALVKEADDCEEFQTRAIAAMKQERLDRLNNIRNKFESGGKTQSSSSKGGRARSQTTL